MSSVPPSADNGYTIPLDASMTQALFQGVFTSVHGRLETVEAKGVDWDTALATQSTELAEAMFLNSVEPHVTQLQDEITVLRASIQDAEDQLTALLSGGIQANSVTVQPITNLTATNAQAAFAEIVSVTTTLSQSVTSLGQNKLDANKVGAPNGVAGLDSEGALDWPVGSIVQAFEAPSSEFLEVDGAIYAQADHPELAALIGTPGNLWPASFRSCPTGVNGNYPYLIRWVGSYYMMYYRDSGNEPAAAWCETLDGPWNDLGNIGDSANGAWFGDTEFMFSGRVIGGSYNQYVRSVDITTNPPTNKSTQYLSTGSEYNFKGMAQVGSTWVAIQDRSGDYIYMYKSTDGGVTWSSPTDIKASVGATTTQAAIHEVAGLLVLYARNGLIATSDDAGDTWTVRRAEDASGEGLNGVTASGTWRRFFFRGYYYLQLNGPSLIRTVDGMAWEVIILPDNSQAVYCDADADFFIVRSMADGTLYYVTSDMETFDLRELPAGSTFSTLLELIGGELVINDSMALKRTDFNGRSYDPVIEFPVPTYTPPPGEPSKFIKA